MLKFKLTIGAWHAQFATPNRSTDCLSFYSHAWVNHFLFIIL